MQHIICRSPNKCLIIEFHKWSYRPDRIAVEVYVNSYSAPGSVRAQMAYYRAFPETMAQNVQRAQRKLAMPILALGGDHGVGDLPQAMLKPVALDVRGGVTQGCGHFAPEECPEGLLAEPVPFLQKNR
jgi:pimeloyl-ACP methyl ester carboxylesterase